MSLPDRVKKEILARLPGLVPQPHTAQVELTMELADAETKLGLNVVDYTLDPEFQIVVMKDTGGVRYHPLWVNNGRPYIRTYDPSLSDLVDIFLLPPQA